MLWRVKVTGVGASYFIYNLIANEQQLEIMGKDFLSFSNDIYTATMR